MASFHLVRERHGRAVHALARLGFDRPRLARTDGLEFWRLLGTGRGDDTGPGADLRRTAVFAVWRTEADLERFMASSPIARRWKKAEEAWHVRLRGIGGHGSWRGVDPLDGLTPGTSDGPIAVITRADVRARSWRAFGRAGREVDAELHTAEGLLAVIGIGEAPVGRLGTFSLWASSDAVRAFAYSMPRHQQVIEETRAGDWYGEELFARFEPFASTGTWDGRDPLAGAEPVNRGS
ncbi:MAG: spheroidene monooxygenase [Ilumatobacter sp.]|nr:spheroidene monooxygenase [Ilumatobacter sp.]